MKVYYAHPISMYGCEQESDDIEFLKSLGLIVCNPAKIEKVVDPWESAERMEWFCNLVRKCDCLAFRSFVGGKIGSGVLHEISAMQCKGGFVFEIEPYYKDRGLTLEQTRQELKQIKQKKHIPLALSGGVDTII